MLVAGVVGVAARSRRRLRARRRGVPHPWAALPVFLSGMQLVPAAADLVTFLLAWELMARARPCWCSPSTPPRRDPRGGPLVRRDDAPQLRPAPGRLRGARRRRRRHRLRAIAGPIPAAGAASLAFVLLVARVRHQGGRRAAPRLAAARPPRGAEPRVRGDERGDGQDGRLRAAPGHGAPAARRARPGGPPCWSALGALSALYGILQASVASDLKRLLAYSTTENVGLVVPRARRRAAPARHGAAGPARRSPCSPACCSSSATPPSRRPCSSEPARCCTRPASATWTGSAGSRTGCRDRGRLRDRRAGSGGAARHRRLRRRVGAAAGAGPRRAAAAIASSP